MGEGRVVNREKERVETRKEKRKKAILTDFF